MAADHARLTGETHTAVEIAARAESENGAARATLSRYADRLARGLAHVVNIIDPDARERVRGVNKVRGEKQVRPVRRVLPVRRVHLAQQLHLVLQRG
jgi:fructokinase